MTVEERIQAIIDSMDPSPTFLWGTVFEHNLVLDSLANGQPLPLTLPLSLDSGFPVVLMLPPIIEGMPTTHKRVLNRYVVTLLFVDKIELLEEQDTTGKSKVQAMRDLAFNFLGKAIAYVDALQQPQAIENYLLHAPNPDDKLNPDEFFNQLDINVAGYGLTFDLPVLEKIQEC